MCVLMRQGWKNENLVEEMEAPFKHIKYLIKLKNKKSNWKIIETKRIWTKNLCFSP